MVFMNQLTLFQDENKRMYNGPVKANYTCIFALIYNNWNINMRERQVKLYITVL